VDGYGVITVSKNVSGKITISFPYDPQLVAKVKTIESRNNILYPLSLRGGRYDRRSNLRKEETPSLQPESVYPKYFGYHPKMGQKAK
jgi:hypothetical protein